MIALAPAPLDFDDPTVIDAEPQVPEAFHVKDAESANWVVRHINDARAYAERIKEWAAKETARAEKEASFFENRFGPELAAWAKQELATEKRRKSVNLPAGQVGFRKEPAKLNVADEKLVLAWAKARAPQCVETVPAHEKLRKSELALVFKNTGEVPPGTDVTEEGERFFVK